MRSEARWCARRSRSSRHRIPRSRPRRWCRSGRRLEVHARAAGLLGELQRVTNAKTFKAAKKKLGIMSRRDGFGRDGEWSWELPTTRTLKPVEMAADITSKGPAFLMITAVWLGRPAHDGGGEHVACRARGSWQVRRRSTMETLIFAFALTVIALLVLADASVAATAR